MKISIKFLIIFFFLQVSQSHQISTRINEILGDAFLKLARDIMVELKYDEHALRKGVMKVQKELIHLTTEFQNFIKSEFFMEKSSKKVLDKLSSDLDSSIYNNLFNSQDSEPKIFKRRANLFKEFNFMEMANDFEFRRQTRDDIDNLIKKSKIKKAKL